jgi:hypothetical protein
MRKIKDVLRLRHELGLGQRQIARSCAIAQATVADYLKRAAAAGIGWPLPQDWDEARLEKAVFGAPATPQAKASKPLPDMAAVREQLQRHRDLTLQLIWEEYRQSNPDGYGYSYFCERYEHWRRQQDVVLRQEHRPGEKLFVDLVGREFRDRFLSVSHVGLCLIPQREACHWEIVKLRSAVWRPSALAYTAHQANGPGMLFPGLQNGISG